MLGWKIFAFWECQIKRNPLKYAKKVKTALFSIRVKDINPYQIHLNVSYMPREKRTWHPEFVRYMRFIVNHKNYRTMPNRFKSNGEIRWVSPSDKERAGWWDKKVSEMDLSNRAEVARVIHPKELEGLKPCQICGRKLSIFYIYPNKNVLKRIKKITGVSLGLYDKDIYMIFDILSKRVGDNIFQALREIFDVPETIREERNAFLKYILESCKSKLSPGVMSNPPDRLDGFHTYNACCRSKEDTGRHRSNLARYTQDRRAYENWAGGNWNMSNRLMGEFKGFDDKVVCPWCGNERKMTADHIGPISLGFTHRPKFNPLCSSCNSRKNNRITFGDVRKLIEDENNGEKIISWHSKYVWDKLKHKIKDDKDAWKLHKVMRWHLHNVLSLLSRISSEGHREFLMRFLHPEYSFVDYKFKSFHPLKLESLVVLKKSLDSENKRKNAERYVRISFESLEQYKDKYNRRVKRLEDGEIDKLVEGLLALLDMGNRSKSYEEMDKIIRRLSEEAVKGFY